ncbi:hypothetical protein VTJ04DRAFT_10557 [Mycothermus thermophilus]|uniref:uncharacterized protein n=1 Tax=Humicola insolens TaxID=85995 RepID=UPI003744918C
MVKFSLLTAIAAALPSVLATPVAAPSNSSAPATLSKRGEGVHIFNCWPTSSSANNWISVVAYCANDADCSNPNHHLDGANACVMKLSLNNGNFHIWEGYQQSCKFPTGVTFTWNIDKNAQSQKDYTYVGSGQNDWTKYRAYKDDKTRGATWANHWCQKIYYFLP